MDQTTHSLSLRYISVPFAIYGCVFSLESRFIKRSLYEFLSSSYKHQFCDCHSLVLVRLHVGLCAKCLLQLSMQIKTAMAGKCFLNFSNATLQENPSVGSWVCKYAQTDRQTVRQTDKQTGRRMFVSYCSRSLDGRRRHVFKYIILKNQD
jgi:hypothetical protein